MNYGGFGYVADSCPRDRTEFTDSATRLNCSVYENGRSRYVYVPNIQKSAIVEFCNKNAARVFKQGEHFANVFDKNKYFTESKG